MPRPIQFEFSGEIVQFAMHKVDRSRLYGFKEVEVIDESGRECELMTLADDGKTLIGKGGTGIGYLTADGNWADKTGLKPVGLDGDPIEPVPSSFAAPIQLREECSVDDYLEHNIRLVYLLEQETISEPLFQRLIDGAIFKFEYSYRGGLVADIGFVVMNEEQKVFFLVGDHGNVEFKNLQQVSPASSDEGELSGDAGDDLMDFGMI